MLQDYLKLNKNILIAILTSIIISAAIAQLLSDQEVHRCDEAREMYSKFRVRHPDSAYTNEIEFIMASCLEDEGKLKLALARFKSLEGKYKYPALLKMKMEGVENRINKGGKSKRKVRRGLRMRKG